MSRNESQTTKKKNGPRGRRRGCKFRKVDGAGWEGNGVEGPVERKKHHDKHKKKKIKEEKTRKESPKKQDRHRLANNKIEQTATLATVNGPQANPGGEVAEGTGVGWGEKVTVKKQGIEIP